MSATRARIAVAGVGLIGRRHAELIAASASADLAGLADPGPHAAAVARSLGTAGYGTLEALLAAERPHGVIVATPNAMHHDGVMTCIGAGVPALVEKPIASTVADGLHLAEVSERAGVALLVGHHRRHSPLVAAARQVIGSGELGRLVGVVGTALFYKPDDYFESAPWRTRPGGGPVLINLIHEIDSLRVLVGEIVSVQATGSNEVRGFPVEDTVAIAMRFAGGLLGTFLLSDTAASAHSWEQASGEDPAYAHDPEADSYLIVGTRGSLAIPTMRLVTSDGAPSWMVPMRRRRVAVDRGDPLQLQLEHFCDVVRGDAEPMVTARDAVQSLRVTEAVAAAIRSGTATACGPVEPPPGPALTGHGPRS